jgi:hypothetical protein
VRLQVPDHAVYPAGVALDLRAEAIDDSSIAQVAYYDETNWIGTSPYQITWTNPTAGQHLLRAVATDNQSLSAGSAEYEITVVAGAPPNDNFAASIVLAGSFASVSGHNVGATAEPNEPAHGFATTNSVWYSWTAPANGFVTVTVRSAHLSIPVILAYTGNTLSTLIEVGRSAVGLNPDGNSVTFSAVSGTTYRLLVAAWGSQAGSFVLEVRPAQPPLNDDFANRIPLAGAPVTTAGSNHDATREPGEPSLTTSMTRASVWWSWTAPSNGVFAVDTIDSTFPAGLGIFQGNDLHQLVRIGAGLGGKSGGFDTSVRFHATAGTTYQISVDGEEGTRGNLNLTIRPARPPSNDDFVNRTLLTGTNVTVECSNVDATREPGERFHGFEPGGGTVWWSWTAPFNGSVLVRAEQPGFPLALSIYTGTTLSTLTYVVRDVVGGGARFNATAGMTYQIVMDSPYGVAESFSLRIERVLPPTNDNFGNRAPLSGFVSTGFGANAEATAEASEPQHSPPAAPSHSMWWTWTAPASGSFVLDAQASTFATASAVYTGNALASLMRVGDNATGGNQMTFSAEAGTLYQIAVDGKGGATGKIQFTLRPAFPPANDNFVSRIAVTGSTVRVIAFNTGATVEPNEPVHGGVTGGASVWWTWTAPESGRYTVAVTDTTFPALLGLYAGTSIGNLTRVSGDIEEMQNQITFRAAAGTAYQIAVDGYLGGSGAIQLDVRPAHPPLNDNFEDRIQLTGESFRQEANNLEASTEQNEPSHGQASVWWTWTAPGSGRFTVRLHSYGGRALVIYTGNALSNLTRVAEGNVAHIGRRATFPAAAGTTYQIAVAGSPGEFMLALAPAASPPNDDFADRELLTGIALRVNGSTVEAMREPNEPISGYGASVWYTWIAPATGEVTINTEDNGAYTGIKVYTGNALSSLTAVPQSNSPYGGLGRLVTFSALAGQAYQIAVDTVDQYQGIFHLRLVETPAPIEEMPVFALPVQLEDGSVQLNLSGQPNRAYVLEASEDLEQWIPIATNSAPNGLLIWTDFAATNLNQRFYRALAP